MFFWFSCSVMSNSLWPHGLHRRRCQERNSFLSTSVLSSLPGDFIGSWRTCLVVIFSWSLAVSLKIYETSDLPIQFLGIYPIEFTKINKDEIVGWHHWLDEHEFEQAPGVGDGQGVLQSMRWQRAKHGWATELKQRCLHCSNISYNVKQGTCLWVKDEVNHNVSSPQQNTDCSVFEKMCRWCHIECAYS